MHLQILESLDFKDLISIKQTNKQLSLLAEFVFHRKFAGKIIRIVEPTYKKEEIFTDGEIIEIHNAHNILNLLNYFGAHITKLEVRFGPNDDEYRDNIYNTTVIGAINKLISLKCAKNLVYFNVYSCFEFFNDIAQPFERAENVTISGHFNKLGNSNLSFTELFPAVKRLSLPCTRILDMSGVIQTIPQLEHLEMGIYKFDYYPSELEIEMMLRLNPQIKSFCLSNGNRKLLDTINKISPNLDSLDLQNYNPESNDNFDEETYFKNVKVFTIYPWNGLGPNRIRFANLTELYTDAIPKLPNFERQVDLLKPFKTLKKLYVHIGCVDYEQLKAIMLTQPNLIEVALKVCKEIGYEQIVEFVKHYQQMENFKLTKEHTMEPAARMIRKLLPDTWNMKESEHLSKLDNGYVYDSKYVLSIKKKSTNN